MAQSIEESLLQAVKKDDIKAFNALPEKARSGAYRLGRFPVLSLLYLYKSRRILYEYEQRFLKITSLEELSEPAEISKKFSAKAGKCLRLYLSEQVSPLEMLLIADKIRRLKRVYPKAKASEAVRARLKSIYYIKYSLSVKFEGENIIIDRRPLSYREKKNIATATLCSLLAVTLAVGVPVTTISLMPKPVEGEVKKLSDIDFNSKKQYTLKRDIVLPENYSLDKVNCKINGEGHKLIFGGGASLGVLNGSISDAVIESRGAVFTVVNDTAVIENVTVNVSADASFYDGTALVAVTNFGTIEGVTVNVSGTLNALVGDSDGTQEISFGGIVLNNAYRTSRVYGTIKNCTVSYTDFYLKGEANANAQFGGVAGDNSGYLQDCTVTGKIIADTFDIAGVCLTNTGVLSGSINKADLVQTSSSYSWNPIACGIVLTNGGTVSNCENRGKVSAVSNCEKTEEQAVLTSSASGITYVNSGTVEGCINSGSLTAEGTGEAYVGGICAHSYTVISYCLSSGEIAVSAQSVYAGGILASSEITVRGLYVYCGTVDYCISESKITAASTGAAPSYIGGIAGFIKQTGINRQYFGGGVTYSYFTGNCAAENAYFGGITGGCGANIYESNSYTLTDGEYHYFEHNYYSDKAYNALGTAVADDGSPVAAEDMNKGAQFAEAEVIKSSENYLKILNALKSE